MICPNCKSFLPDGMSVCTNCNCRLNTVTVFSDSNGTAIASFCLALASLFLPILVIPAIICGHIGLSHSLKSCGRTGYGLAVTALVIGYLCVLIWLLLGILFFTGILALLTSV